MASRLSAAAVGVVVLLAVVAPVAATAPVRDARAVDATATHAAATPVPDARDGTTPTVRAAPPVPTAGRAATTTRAAVAGVALDEAARARDACPASKLSFGRHDYVVQRGDVARLGVLSSNDLSGTDFAFYVSDEDGRYEAHASLHDGDGDGRVTVLFDTAAAGSGRPAEALRTAAAADAVTDRTETALDGPLPVGSYRLTVLAAACIQGHATLVVAGPRFAAAPYREHRGDVVRVPVAVPDGSAATVTVQGNDSDYAATVTLHDGNDDGRVTLLWNTYEAGSDDPGATFRTAADGDAVTVRDETTLLENHRYYLLPAGAYDLRVGSGSNATPAADRTTLRLDGPDALNVTVLRAAGDQFENLTSPADVAALRRAGELGRAPWEEAVLSSDLLVLRVRAPGLAGAFATADGPNATARFEALLDEELGFVFYRPELASVPGQSLRFDNFTRRRVVPDPANDTYYLVIDSYVPAGTSSDTVIENYGPYTVSVVVPPDARVPGAGRENATETVAFVEPTASLRAEVVENVTVTGTALVPLGSEVVVRVRGNASALPVDRRVAVGPDGRFEAVFDLSSLEACDRVELVVRHDDRTLAHTPALVESWATVRFDGGERYVQNVEVVRVDAVATTCGGFVVVHRGAADGPVVGFSRYLSPGNHSEVEVPLTPGVLDGNVTLVADAHWDTDGDQTFGFPSDHSVDGPYHAGDPSDAATLEDVDGTPSTTLSSRPPGTPSATVTATPPATSGPSDVIPAPGAGPAAVALVVAAALAVVRRRRRSRGE